MNRIVPGRFVPEVDGDFVVFLIDMRINRPWKLRSWLPVYRAMPWMLEALERAGADRRRVLHPSTRSTPKASRGRRSLSRKAQAS